MSKKQSKSLSISVGARNSPLSRTQIDEVARELQRFCDVEFTPVWVETMGDRDKTTSLRTLEKTDFFTREIDQKLIAGEFRVAIHSAKDLPDPIPPELKVVALTQGVDPADVIVYREPLNDGARIGTSSLRREESLAKQFPTFQCADIRGTIGERLALLDAGKFDGVVMAKAALIRLNICDRPYILLDGETHPLQGRLAVVARQGDQEMEILFRSINSKQFSIVSS